MMSRRDFQDTRQLLPDDAAAGAGGSGAAVVDRAIGQILADLRQLTPDQVDKVLQHQRAKGLRFGEAAVELGLVENDDVLVALSRQFHYPYAPKEQRQDSPDLVALNEPFSYRAETFRALRSQLLQRLWGKPVARDQRRALAVISADIGDGKTYCVSNLAVAMAQLGGHTLLVDADLRNPRAHEVFHVDNSRGLSGILSGRAEKNIIQPAAGIAGLYVLPSGVAPPNPLELVERPAFGMLLAELTAKFDHVLVDSPAAAHGADAGVIAARCGAALVVARRNASRVGALQDLVGSLNDATVQVAGVVMNEW
jgi:protein-tyrosine kinase